MRLREGLLQSGFDERDAEISKLRIIAGLWGIPWVLEDLKPQKLKVLSFKPSRSVGLMGLRRSRVEKKAGRSGNIAPWRDHQLDQQHRKLAFDKSKDLTHGAASVEKFSAMPDGHRTHAHTHTHIYYNIYTCYLPRPIIIGRPGITRFCEVV